MNPVLIIARQKWQYLLFSTKHSCTVVENIYQGGKNRKIDFEGLQDLKTNNETIIKWNK